MSTIPLTPFDLLLAAALSLVVAALSIALRLGLERPLAVAMVRMVVQLALVGIALKFVLEQSSPLWSMLLALIMVAVAGFELLQRQRLGAMRVRLLGLGTGTLFAVGLLTTIFTMAVVIGPEPWYAPRYVLPILGMVLGNALTAISLVVADLTESAKRDRAAIETRLALGDSRIVALSEVIRKAMITGMTPTLNAMAVAGVVSLPGMMTGQILAGADPIEAAKYQIVILSVLAAATGVAAALGAAIGITLLTDERHRLRLDRLR